MNLLTASIITVVVVFSVCYISGNSFRMKKQNLEDWPKCECGRLMQVGPGFCGQWQCFTVRGRVLLCLVSAFAFGAMAFFLTGNLLAVIVTAAVTVPLSAFAAWLAGNRSSILPKKEN